jgi:hypothetical protein
VTIDKINYKGWPNSYRIANGEVEAVVTSDVGPRVMRYGFAGGQNFFKEFEESLGKSGEPSWQLRGGHRIWAAPEDPVRTYAPDNGPVRVEIRDGVLEATEPVEESTGLEKQLAIEMAPAGTRVTVRHRIRNAGSGPLTLAPWALSMMAPGGAGIHGFPPRGTHPEMLAPTNPLVMWAFTNLADQRWRLLERYMVLLQDPNNPAPQKLGSFHPRTWAGYLLNGELFIKRCQAPGDPKQYPDLGCSFEAFTNAAMLELETLGPLETLPPGESLTHVEHWTLHRPVHVVRWADDELDQSIAPLAATAW